MDAVILLPTVIVKGQLHPKLANDPQGYLTLEAGSFVPVTAATVYGHCDAEHELESPVVVVNKDTISSLSWTPANPLAPSPKVRSVRALDPS